jgi:hypothetical protein
MSVQGKKRNEWVALTLTDFGDPARREVLRHHFTTESAYRAFPGILKIYTAPALFKDKTSRVWQETREGEILNDSGLS